MEGGDKVNIEKKEFMMKKNIFMALFILFLSAQSGYAQSDATEVAIKATPVAGTVFMLEGEGGNIGVSAGEDGVLMVDDKFAKLADQIRAAIEKLSTSQVKFVLNTHWHGDHTGGNEDFGRDATIIAHDNVRVRLSKSEVIKLFNMVSEPKPKVGLPVITFDKSVTIHFNNERIDVVHFPTGHTDGDSVVFFRGSNVVHTGDHFFNGIYPFIDLGTGGNVEGFMNNVAKLIEIIPQDAKIIPGHGPLATLEDLKAFHAMLRTSTDVVQQAIESGKNLEETKAAGLPEELVAKWGKGFLSTDQWIEIIYNSYSN